MPQIDKFGAIILNYSSILVWSNFDLNRKSEVIVYFQNK